MNDIKEKQYKNFRDSFNNILLRPIMGDNYYTTSMDIYNSDRECCEDLKYKYDCLLNKVRVYKTLFILSFVMLLITYFLLIIK